MAPLAPLAPILFRVVLTIAATASTALIGYMIGRIHEDDERTRKAREDQRQRELDRERARGYTDEPDK